MKLHDTLEWLKARAPTAPYRVGAAKSGDRFGFRKDLEGSPLHLGTDRSLGSGIIKAPFSGTVRWKSAPETDWGSFLALRSEELLGGIELQIAHTERGGLEEPFTSFYSRGQTLPMTPGKRGLAFGVHTHTELVVPYSTPLFESLKAYEKETFGLPYTVLEGAIVFDAPIKAYADNCGITLERAQELIKAQIRDWAITTVGKTYVIRKALPPYRRYNAELGAVILLDSEHWLNI